MQKYLGVISVALFILSAAIFLIDTGDTPAYFPMIFFLLSVSGTIITAIFSTKIWRIVLLTVYGLIILIFIIFALGLGIAHM
ncbi:hypothetical protein SAMN04489762_3109 [Terribacillus saccharophilus]|uniref:Uncharacterized protein n=1 Tax=Terribacillus saccharophilus TaxID=361277 RepID=A0A075LIG7_9BACI|nr:hypothetical protein GZ22_02930 [Terribacillus goriensis]SEN93084.1 hypothetical protein SAMN04489762_3109 [Terribacillus saccharophilus]